MSFLVLWSFCFSFSQVHFRNGPEYLTRGTAKVFIPLIIFSLRCYISSSFLVLQRDSFLIFTFISTCLMVSAFNISKYLYVSFSPSVFIFSGFGSSISSALSRFRFSLLVWFIFPCQIPFLCLDSIFSLPVSGFPLLFHFLQRVWCRPCTLGDWSFLTIYQVCIHLCISWVCGWVA